MKRLTTIYKVSEEGIWSTYLCPMCGRLHRQLTKASCLCCQNGTVEFKKAEVIKYEINLDTTFEDSRNNYLQNEVIRQKQKTIEHQIELSKIKKDLIESLAREAVLQREILMLNECIRILFKKGIRK